MHTCRRATPPLVPLHLDSFGGTTRAFVLTAGFPPKPLSDPTLTLEAAGLKAASITQKEA
jgi:hypothetical protein